MADIAAIIRAGQPLVGQELDRLEKAIFAWLDTKHGRSGSIKTLAAYADGITRFRAALQASGLDLDSGPHPVALAAQGWAASRHSGSRGKGPVSPATYNVRLAILSSFYEYAQKRGFLAGPNPIALVERRVVEAYATALSLNDTDLTEKLRLIDRRGIAGARDYALLVIFLQTGRRLAEVAGLRWGDVQINDTIVTLQFRHAKGGKALADTLSTGVARALLDYLHQLHGANLNTLATDTPLWVSFASNNRGHILSPRSIAEICRTRLGVSKVHTLRHTFARAMEDEGAKVSEIQARLGHTSLATTGRYLAALKRAENPHAERLAKRFGIEK